MTGDTKLPLALESIVAKLTRNMDDRISLENTDMLTRQTPSNIARNASEEASKQILWAWKRLPANVKWKRHKLNEVIRKAMDHKLFKT